MMQQNALTLLVSNWREIERVPIELGAYSPVCRPPTFTSNTGVLGTWTRISQNNTDPKTTATLRRHMIPLKGFTIGLVKFTPVMA